MWESSQLTKEGIHVVIRPFIPNVSGNVLYHRIKTILGQVTRVPLVTGVHGGGGEGACIVVPLVTRGYMGEGA